MLKLYDVNSWLLTEYQINLLIKRGIAPGKAVNCVFMQFLGPENAIKFISVRKKTK